MRAGLAESVDPKLELFDSREVWLKCLLIKPLVVSDSLCAVCVNTPRKGKLNSRLNRLFQQFRGVGEGAAVDELITSITRLKVANSSPDEHGAFGPFDQ